MFIKCSYNDDSFREWIKRDILERSKKRVITNHSDRTSALARKIPEHYTKIKKERHIRKRPKQAGRQAGRDEKGLNKQVWT
jgi:hypothetical protein